MELDYSDRLFAIKSISLVLIHEAKGHWDIVNYLDFIVLGENRENDALRKTRISWIH